MEPRDIKTLLLLETIGKDECLSQRDLSRKLNISLGLVNSFINKLLAQGVFNVSKRSKNRIKYNLSQKGISIKSELSKEYFEYSLGYYKAIKQRISKSLQMLAKNDKTNIILYGVGELCEIACIVIHEENISGIRIIDEKNAGKKICGIKVADIDAIDKSSFDAIIIVDFENASSYQRYLIQKGVPIEKIHDLAELYPVVS
jgi:NADH/NAD ratio-sensing transcriptional regulator Rex